MLIMFAFVKITLINLVLKTNISNSLNLSSFYNVFLLFLAFCYYKITSNFLINKLYAKGYLLPFAKQVTKTF